MNKMLKENQKKQTIRISGNVEVFWCSEKRILILKGLLKRKVIKIDHLIRLECIKHRIEITTNVFGKLSNYKKKKIRSLQKTTTAFIKQGLIEVNAPIYRKLKFVGVGYRAFPVEGFENDLFLLRLGYSHPIYFRIPSGANIFCLKLTKLFVYGHSYNQITSIASKIRLNKVPEPYKGKGILYEHEKVTLKEGKKV